MSEDVKVDSREFMPVQEQTQCEGPTHHPAAALREVIERTERQARIIARWEADSSKHLGLIAERDENIADLRAERDAIREAYAACQRDFDTLAQQSYAAREELRKAREALVHIERWGPFPPCDRLDGQPSTFGREYGSNGERDYMRGIARAALSAKPGGGESE